MKVKTNVKAGRYCPTCGGGIVNFEALFSNSFVTA